MGICGSSQGGAFRKLYELDEKTVLSERRGATVFRGRHRASGALVAIKRVDKPMPQDAKSPSIPPHSLPPLQLTPPSSWENEVAILQQCAGHKHIIAFRAAFEMPTHALLVMEYVEGGELFDALISDGAYSEWDAKRFVHDILQALAFLHARNIIHRDIKPENLVFTSRDSKVASIKVVNFAMAKRVYHESTDGDDQLTWPYCAPEILASFGGLSSRSASRSASMAVNAHDTADTPVLPTSPPPVGVKCDMWSVGIVLYVLLSGAHPFDLDGRQPRDQIVGNILLGKFTMSDESPVWRQISSEAKDFLRKLLQVDPEKRLSAEEALAHKWFMAPDTPRSPLSVSVSDGLGQYQRLMRKKFRTSVLVAMAAETFRRSLRKHRNSSISTSSPLANAARTEAPAKVGESVAAATSSDIKDECVRSSEAVEAQQFAASAEPDDASESLAAVPFPSTKAQGSILSRVFQKRELHEDPTAPVNLSDVAPEELHI